MAQFIYTSNASIYPDDLATKHTTIDVYGLAGQVTSTSVGIEGFYHSYPADIDMLLVGPRNHNLAFMTDAGGSIDAVGLDFSFSDAGVPLVFPFAEGGVYKPADGGESESGSNWGLPNLTIQHPNSGATFASAFNGINGNGKWSLYVHDDAAVAEGGISGWNLTVKTAESFAVLNGTGTDDKISVITTNFLGGEGVFQINDRGVVVFKDATFFKINAGAGNDWVVGGIEADSINAGSGRDSVYAGSGNDYISIGAANDEAGEVYDGGSGSDWIFKQSDQTLDLRDDTVKSIETLSFQAGGMMHINAAR